jgi:hypothetical protein
LLEWFPATDETPEVRAAAFRVAEFLNAVIGALKK